MSEKYVLALDLGTTSARAIVFDRAGEIMGVSRRDIKQIYPQEGYVEHNPMEIFGATMGVISEAILSLGLTMENIDSIGLTNQRETTVVWNKLTGKPIYNAIVWQCRRTAQMCERLKKDGYQDMIYSKTGLMVDAYFSATKLRWILDNVSGARESANRGELCFGTIDTFIMWHLSGGKIFATDYTNASRTMLYNIHTLEWDEELEKLFDIPHNMLPKVYPSSHFFGVTSAYVVGRSIPICGVAGDQQASLFGQKCFDVGDVKNTYGTGCFMLMNTGNVAVNSTHGLITTLAAGEGKPNFALEGSVFVAGAVVQWLRDEMRLIKTSAESEKYAREVTDCGGVYVVPAFVGLGAPHWDSEARGVICGITRSTKKEHIIRASLESIAYQTYDVLRAFIKDTGREIASLKVDGGASENDFLMQFQADILGANVARPKCLESTALGASMLSGLHTGYYANTAQIVCNDIKKRVFSPSISAEKRNELLRGWETAIGRARL